MKIYTIWVTDHPSTEPWLINAWDEYSIDENPEGYEKAVNEARKFKDSRIIIVECDDLWSKVKTSFSGVIAKGRVVE